MDELEERRRAAERLCTSSVVRPPAQTPAESFAALARACEELGVEEWDTYGERGHVAALERQVAELLGKPAGVFFVSGVMAQQAALRVWCERRGSLRVALPDLSHLLVHEDDGPRLLHGFRFEHLTVGRRTPSVKDLDALPPGLGAVLVELPLRDAGCLLPDWDDLAGLSARARKLGTPLHFDGARLWESQPFYGRPLADIAALADSVYVSFYKGLEGLSGAVLVGEQDVLDEVRVWRRRMGGTVYRMTPYAVSALVGLRDRLGQMGEYVAWARALAAELTSVGIQVNPDPPHTNTFQVFARADPDAVTRRLVELMEREHVQPCHAWRAADVPGTAMTEVAVHAGALDLEPSVVAGWFADLVTP